MYMYTYRSVVKGVRDPGRRHQNNRLGNITITMVVVALLLLLLMTMMQLLETKCSSNSRDIVAVVILLVARVLVENSRCGKARQQIRLIT